MLNLLLVILVFINTVFAAGPTYMRTTVAVAIPFEEFSMSPPSGGCSAWTACMKVGNWSPTWLALDVPEWGTSNATTNRVFTADAVFDGIYLDTYPQVTGAIKVVLNNQEVVVPLVTGNFISAIRPCTSTASIPTAYLRVDPNVRSITIVGHTMIVTGDDRATDLVFDAVKRVLVRAPLQAYGTVSGVYTVKRDLYDGNGTPITYRRPFSDTRVGPGYCRDRH